MHRANPHANRANSWHYLILVLLSQAIITSTLPATESSPGWLNVQDYGASGSKFETSATTTEGSTQVTVADAGDFKVGQGVMVSKSNIRFTPTMLWGTGERYQNMKPLQNSVEVRGFDGSTGSWVIYVIDIEPSPTPMFRWSDDLGRTWQPKQPITHDWQKLSGGTEVRLNQRDWEAGYVIAFGARDQLISRIEKIEGHTLTLHDPANRTVKDAVIRHNDTLALQTSVDRALKEKLKVFVPAGHYRLAQTIRVRNPESLTIEGANSVDTVFDISEGEGACFSINGGTEATLRNFRMFGFMGFDERDRAGELRTLGSTAIWGFLLKHCNAVDIANTRRVLVENCHASRMSGECFVSSSRSRPGLPLPVAPGTFQNPSVPVDPRAVAGVDQPYCQGITYLRCSVTDSARNAFNDVLCGTENTVIQNCRIIDVGGCAWEGASRFVKFTGNYIRNAGTVAIGNLGPANRDATFPALGAGQIIVADNVFENNIPYGGCAIRSARGASQVIIRNNLFINFNSSAVEVTGPGYINEFPAGNTTITGNIFDMTASGLKSVPRTAINIMADDTLISDNQIYVRGTNDANVTGIRLREPALNAIAHDNLLRNLGTGIISDTTQTVIGEVIDPTTFIAGAGTIPLNRWWPQQYHGWTFAWFQNNKPAGTAEIDSFDAATSRFKLTQPAELKTRDRFEIYPPAANWNLHDNTLTDCLKPIVLNSHGSPTSILKDNVITRRDVTAQPEAIQIIRGQFELLNNHFTNPKPPTTAASENHTPKK